VLRLSAESGRVLFPELPRAMARHAPVPAQMWQESAQPRCRCGSDEPSLGCRCGQGEPSLGCRRGRGEPSPGRRCGRGEPSPGRRCGSDESSPGLKADLGGVTCNPHSFRWMRP
jgi:hypothetical protein